MDDLTPSERPTTPETVQGLPRRLLSRLLRLVRSPRFLAALALVVVVVGTGIGFVWWKVRSLVSPTCDRWEAVDLTVAQVVALRDRRKAHARAQVEPDAFYEITGPEATFLLRDETDLGLWFRTQGDRLHIHATAPTQGGCYNVDFEGSVVVRDGKLRAEPDQLVVGGSDVTAWFWLARALWGAEVVQADALRNRLDNIETLEVVDDHIRMRFYDPWKEW